MFSKLDFYVILVSTLFLIIASFVFPTLGFASASVTQSDIPSYNASIERFSYINESPTFPTRPSEGTLKYIDDNEELQDKRQIWLRGDSSDGILISLINDGNLSNPQPEIALIKFNSSGSFSTIKLINESEYKTIENYSFIVEFDNVRVSNINQSDLTFELEWTIEQQPEDTTWLGRIPGVGGLLSAGNQLPAILAWGVSVIFQPIHNATATVANTLIIGYNIITFGLSIFYWLLSTYGSIVSSAPETWVQIFLTVPALLLSIEFSRVVYRAIQLVIGAIPLT